MDKKSSVQTIDNSRIQWVLNTACVPFDPMGTLPCSQRLGDSCARGQRRCAVGGMVPRLALITGCVYLGPTMEVLAGRQQPAGKRSQCVESAHLSCTRSLSRATGGPSAMQF